MNGFTGGTASGLLSGESFGDALALGAKGALFGAAVGGMVGTAQGIRYAKANNLDAWSGDVKIDRAIGAAPKGFSKAKSINQLNKFTQTGKSPKTITRFDKGKILGELDHVHFSNGSALNINGTWKHGFKVLTNNEIKFLSQNGWVIPK